MSAQPCAVSADLARHLARIDRDEALADAIADRLEEISRDAAYVDYADNLPQQMRDELDRVRLAHIRSSPEMWRAYRALLAEVAEAEAIAARDAAQDEAVRDDLESRQYWRNHH